MKRVLLPALMLFAMHATLPGEKMPEGVNVPLLSEDSMEAVVAKAVLVKPTARQIAWQRQEFSAFIHFGMNTFTDREWGEGNESPDLFNPSALDALQWVRAAKAAGITKMILTAKHHDGFCLWPSKYTEHCVRNSPWKGGKGDVVGDFVTACRAEGMHYGIYISPWDRHDRSYGDSPKYNQHFLDQLREVLTNYPGIEEVWFDGACGEGPNGKKQVYDWRAYWSLIRELVPDATISVRGPDVRWCGNEAGHSRSSEWSVIPLPGELASWKDSDKTLGGYLNDIYGDDLGSRQVLMNHRGNGTVLAWYPSQVNTSIRPGWFYHKSEDDRVRPLSELVDIYYGSVGGNGQFLLNIPPDKRGLFHENDVARLKQLGEVLKASFSRNLASGGKLTSELDGGKPVGNLSAILDGNLDSYWTTTDGTKSATITVMLPASVRANGLALQEHIASSQRVEAFEIEILEGGTWKHAASGSVIGQKRLLRFDDATISGVRVIFKQFRFRPTLASLELFLAPAVLSGPKISRDVKGNVTIKAPDGACARYTLDGSGPGESSPRYTKPIQLPKGGVVLARAFPLTRGFQLAKNAAELSHMDYGPAKATWKIHDCDSYNEANGKPQNAIDENPETVWETRPKDPMPHHIAVDLGEVLNVSGFTYTPRLDRWGGGIVMKARFELSLDGKQWDLALDSVDFDNIVNSRQMQVTRLEKPVAARYFRMTALRTDNDNSMASAADISALVK